MSRVQKSAVLDFLKKSNMGDVDSDQQAKMVAMLQLCDFTEGDKMEIMSVLAPPPPPDPSAPKRLPMQRYYPAIFDYFTAEEWSDMQNPSLQTAMDFLISRTIALGGAQPLREMLCRHDQCTAICVWNEECSRHDQTADPVVAEGRSEAQGQVLAHPGPIPPAVAFPPRP